MDLLTGKNYDEKPMTLSRLWREELRVSFPKGKLISALESRWNLTNSNVHLRLKKGQLVNFVSDIQFLHQNFAIGFDMKRGFFFDEKQWELIEQRDMMENAGMFGMGK
jgi:hypothetical protein